MQDKPLVSVIMNCFNGEKYLHEAINSVCTQTHENWELIFWDNLSTDDSVNVFNKYKDNRLKYFLSDKHTNLSEARALAVNESKGDIITFLDVDDYWSDNFLETQVELYADKKVSFSCGNFFIVKDSTKYKKIYRRYIPSGNVVNDLLVDYFVGLLTLSVRRSAYFNVGGFSSDYHIIGDFDLVMKLALQYSMGSFQMPLAYCRKHGSNRSTIEADLSLLELKKWYEKNNKIFNNRKSINAFYTSIMYKQYSDSIKNNTFTIFYFIEACKSQPIKNNIKIILQVILKKLTKREY